MNAKTEAINFRVESGVADRLRALADQNDRGVSEELRTAIDVYWLLVEMANLRADDRVDPARAIDLEQAIKEGFGRAFLPALSADARNVFEEELGVDYPRDTFREIAIPFDRLLDWVAGIPADSRVSNAELVAQAHNWSDSNPVIRRESIPATGILRSWAKALELAGDETATLSRVQQALRITVA
ncbi:MAG: hypothetical protein J0H06_07060 [Actinobacteria bacterium]|nr:hypothetical protein [Actinomycetota bacterium]OJU80811.1 MAG: hypothetical protein BGO11_19625 [Solirubrobacterales bacterium 70-9]